MEGKCSALPRVQFYFLNGLGFYSMLFVPFLQVQRKRNET